MKSSDSGTNPTAQEFLHVLIPEGFINCRAIDCKKKKLLSDMFFPAGDFQPVQRFIRRYHEGEIYFGVVSRWKRDGSLKGCGNAFALFVDVDFKETPEWEARQQLADFPLAPSIVIFSGGGLHIYFLLTVPFDLRNGDAAPFKSLLRRLGRALKGDLRCSEPVHILRIPETKNHKYPDPPTVTIEVFETERRYRLDDFEFLPPEPETAIKQNAATKRDAASGTVAILNDDEVLAKIRSARNRSKFSRLFDQGDISGYPSWSEADEALCCMLTFYSDDEMQIDRLFRSSALYRKNKWERPDYRKRTLQRAMTWAVERYRPGRNGGSSSRARPSDTGPVTHDPPTFDDAEPAPDADRESGKPRPIAYSDDALAALFTERHEHDFLYVASWGWLQWTGARWQRIPDVVVMGYARQICRQQSEKCERDPAVHGKGRFGLARALASAKVVAATVRLAASDPRHYREVSQFDRDLWLFNTPGGTIHLKTGMLRPHAKEDLITKIANATPAGECPKWRAFLEKITDGDRAMQGYLQRLAGYAMCGDPSEESVHFLYGQGGNGKGTFLKPLQYAFGQYSTTAETETFLETKGERHPTDVAKLAGARLVVAHEINEGQHWNEVRLKTMTGRDEITARFMRRDLFDFIPQFTLIISGNNKPALRGVDEAWRRRFHLVPFTVCIPKPEQNPALKTELQEEANGILKWCLEGCLEWQRQRLNPPEIVLSATTEYLNAEDIFELWLNECCLRAPGYEEPVAWAYTSYRHWKQRRGERPPGMKTFSQRMHKCGFEAGRQTVGKRARVFQGVRLTDDERKTVKGLLDAPQRWERGASDGADDDVV